MPRWRRTRRPTAAGSSGTRRPRPSARRRARGRRRGGARRAVDEEKRHLQSLLIPGSVLGMYAGGVLPSITPQVLGGPGSSAGVGGDPGSMPCRRPRSTISSGTTTAAESNTLVLSDGERYITAHRARVRYRERLPCAMNATTPSSRAPLAGDRWRELQPRSSRSPALLISAMEMAGVTAHTPIGSPRGINDVHSGLLPEGRMSTRWRAPRRWRRARAAPEAAGCTGSRQRRPPPPPPPPRRRRIPRR